MYFRGTFTLHLVNCTSSLDMRMKGVCYKRELVENEGLNKKDLFDS